jgi:C-terminal processing protease CtpA/Prc
MRGWTQARVLLSAAIIVMAAAGCGAREADGPVAKSGVMLTALQPGQAESLTLTGKVWGFLKYHHPAVTDGELDWDAALLRVLPDVLAAPQPEKVQALLVRWIDSLGPVAQCKHCVTLNPKDPQLPPRLAWTQDERLLGRELTLRLQTIYRNREYDQQHYVSIDWLVGNPKFEHEAPYAQLQFPDSGYQILAVLRFWNIVEYWFPYRDLIDENWDEVLLSTLRTAPLAQNREEFRHELMVLIARADDSHADLSYKYGPFRECVLPLDLRHVAGEFVVAGFLGDEAAAGGIRRGDVLLSIDGVPVTDIVARVRRYYGASNDEHRMLSVRHDLIDGPCGKTRVGLRRDGELQLEVTRLPPKSLDMNAMHSNVRPGAAFQKLSPGVAYLKLSTANAADLRRPAEAGAGTKLLIIDLRAYPNYLVHEIGGLLVGRATMFVQFTKADLSNPGAFFWNGSDTLQPEQPRYAGQVAVLVDENTMSLGEYTAMALRASPRAKVFGRTTAGADGTLSLSPLPGGWKAGVSSIGIFYPDKRPTQQIGIVPDVVCLPTIASLRAGRDEVLDCALQSLLETAKTMS